MWWPGTILKDEWTFMSPHGSPTGPMLVISSSQTGFGTQGPKWESLVLVDNRLRTVTVNSFRKANCFTVLFDPKYETHS